MKKKKVDATKSQYFGHNVRKNNNLENKLGLDMWKGEGVEG